MVDFEGKGAPPTSRAGCNEMTAQTQRILSKNILGLLLTPSVHPVLFHEGLESKGRRARWQPRIGTINGDIPTKPSMLATLGGVLAAKY